MKSVLWIQALTISVISAVERVIGRKNQRSVSDFQRTHFTLLGKKSKKHKNAIAQMKGRSTKVQDNHKFAK